MSSCFRYCPLTVPPSRAARNDPACIGHQKESSSGIVDHQPVHTAIPMKTNINSRLIPSIPTVAMLSSDPAIKARHQRAPRNTTATECNTKQLFQRMFRDRGGHDCRSRFSLTAKSKALPRIVCCKSDATKCNTKTAFPAALQARNGRMPGAPKSSRKQPLTR